MAILVFIFTFSILFPSRVFAADCSSIGVTATIPPTVTQGVDTSVTVSIAGLQPNTQYSAEIDDKSTAITQQITQTAISSGSPASPTDPPAGTATFVFTDPRIFNTMGGRDKEVFLRLSWADRCSLGSYNVLSTNSGGNSCDLSVTYSPTYSPQCADSASKFSVNFNNAMLNGSPYTGNIRINAVAFEIKSGHVTNGTLDSPIILGPYSAGSSITVAINTDAVIQQRLCAGNAIPIIVSCQNQAGSGPLNSYDPRCNEGDDSSVKTALGCLPTDPQKFVDVAIPWSVFIGAGIAFLLSLFGMLMIIISAGNPEKMQAGRELFTSAIAGLLIIIFAVFILTVVGVDILKLFLFEEPGHPGGGR